MRLLLDTHAFLWFVTGDPTTSARARSLIEDEGNEKLLSIVTPWEIAIKYSLKKLTLGGPFDQVVLREIEQGGFQILPIHLAHTAAVAALPHHHGDPFDRLLAAQALVEGLPILSGDAAFDPYGVTRLW